MKTVVLVLLTALCVARPDRAGFVTLTHHAVPPNDGGLALMEVELIEPELFFRFDPSCASALADAVADRLRLPQKPGPHLVALLRLLGDGFEARGGLVVDLQAHQRGGDAMLRRIAAAEALPAGRRLERLLRIVAGLRHALGVTLGVAGLVGRPFRRARAQGEETERRRKNRRPKR